MRVDFAGRIIKAAARKGNKGFSFIDALAACFLLTGGLVVVAGALHELSVADSVAEAKVHARTLAASVLSELKGLPIEQVLQYSPETSATATVAVELVNAAGEVVPLPAPSPDISSFPHNIEVRVKASCKSIRGHVVSVQAVGYLIKQELQP